MKYQLFQFILEKGWKISSRRRGKIAIRSNQSESNEYSHKRNFEVVEDEGDFTRRNAYGSRTVVLSPKEKTQKQTVVLSTLSK